MGAIEVRNLYAEVDALREFEFRIKNGDTSKTYSRSDFGVEEWIDIEKLVVDADVQRSLMPSQVKKIMKDFSPSAFGRITVSKVGEFYNIHDGQHRAEVARLLGIKSVPVIVVDAPTKKDEAINFIKINENSMQVSCIDKYRIGWRAGVEEWCRVKEVVEDRCGLEVGTGANKVNAVGSIYKYINTSTLQSSLESKMDTLERSLNILNSTVGVDGICQISLLGMNMFVREYINTNIITIDDAIRRFKSLDVRSLISQAQTLRANGTKSRIISYFAWLLVSEYNNGLRTNKLPLRIEP